MQIDRFLVLQYEGDLHTLTHPEPTTIAQSTSAHHHLRTRIDCAKNMPFIATSQQNIA
jgi:hypothetical protein